MISKRFKNQKGPPRLVRLAFASLARRISGLARAKSDRSSPGGREAGIIIVYEIVLIFIFSMVMMAMISYAVYQLKLVNSITRREQAFQIAEAGINYYQWHLAHFPADYKDGTGAAGPYVHDFVDKDTQITIGRFSLNITPPAAGSTIINIQSTGYTLADPGLTRVVSVRYGIPSLAKYSLLTNGLVWIGAGSTINGTLHSNDGIRFDGTGNAPITSSKSTYNCPSSQGSPCPTSKPGIWGAAAQSTKDFWQFPVPAVDFSAMTSDFAVMKNDAQTNGIYLGPSNAQGYSLVFNAGGTVTIYKVNSLRSHATGYDQNNDAHNEDIDYGTVGGARTKLDGNPGLAGVQDYAMPANGLIFLEDKAWAEGTVKGRALVVATKLGSPYNPATAPSILIPNNILYTAKDGTDALGLIGQKDVLITYYAPDTLEVDAALVAQNGSVQRYDFPGDMKTAITLYGSVMTFNRRVLYWVGSSGFPSINTFYDTNFLYAPPPSFPLSSDGYQQITWESN